MAAGCKTKSEGMYEWKQVSCVFRSMLIFRRKHVKTCNLSSVTELRVVAPNITLYPVWEGEFGVSQVRLICILSGYFPKQLSVEWQQNNQRLSHIEPLERKLESVEGQEKTYSLTTEIKPNMSEWARGSSFTCKSIHKNIFYERTTSICQSEWLIYSQQILN